MHVLSGRHNSRDFQCHLTIFERVSMPYFGQIGYHWLLLPLKARRTKMCAFVAVCCTCGFWIVYLKNAGLRYGSTALARMPIVYGDSTNATNNLNSDKSRKQPTFVDKDAFSAGPVRVGTSAPPSTHQDRVTASGSIHRKLGMPSLNLNRESRQLLVRVVIITDARS